MMPVAPPQSQPIPAQQSGPPPVTIDAVVKLLRNDRMRGFRIDVETDSLVEADQNQEKANANELVSALGNFFKEFGPVVQQMPPLAPMVSQLLCFALRRYKVGAELEETVEKAMNEVQQRLESPAQPHPDPVQEAKTQQAQIKAQAEAQKAAADLQGSRDKAQAEQAKAQLDAFHAKLKHETELELAREKAVMEKEAMMLDAELKRRADEREHQIHSLKITHQQQAHDIQISQSREAHGQTIDKMHHDASIKDGTGRPPKEKKNDEKMDKFFGQLKSILTAPKELVRDDNGEIIGSKVVLDDSKPLTDQAG